VAEIKTLDCGCEIIVATNGSVMLTYCPLHKSAPDLYEACKAQHEAIDILFAMLIIKDKTFFPSKSGIPWEATVKGYQVISKVAKEL